MFVETLEKASVETIPGKLKSDIAFRTIGEVSDSLGIPTHVLRFWETKFTQIRPVKRRGGHRYYRPADIEVIKEIKSLLYDKGFTIKGAQKLLKDIRKANGSAAPIKEILVNGKSQNGANGHHENGYISSNNNLPVISDEVSQLKDIIQDLHQELKQIRSLLKIEQ